MYCNCEAKKIKNEKNIIIVEDKPYSFKNKCYVCECCHCDDTFYLEDDDKHLYCNDCADYCSKYNSEDEVDYDEIMNSGNIIKQNQIIYDN